MRGMIFMDESNFHDQAGMERSFNDYFADVLRQCPGTFNAMLDLHLHSCDYAGRWVILTARVQPWMSNPAGIVHGGITATLLDTALGQLCRYYSGGKVIRTIQVEVSYLRAVPVGATVCIRADLHKMGAGICFAVGSLWVQDRPDRLLATASGSYAMSDPE